MNRGDRVALAVGSAVFALALAFVAVRIEVSTDILAFLPSGEERELADISREIASSELSRTMILTVQADTLARAVEAGRRLESLLVADPDTDGRLAFVEGGPPEGFERALWEIYRPSVPSFLGRTADDARARTDEAGLAAASAELLERLAGPMSTLVSRVAPADPLLVLPMLLERLQAGRGVGLQVVDGRFVSGDAAVIFVGAADSAFDSEAQAPLLAALDAASAAVTAELGADVRVESSGVNRFAVRAEEAIKQDIRRVSIVSSVCMTLLIFGLFRSARLVLVAAVPVLTGVVVGAAVTLGVYGRIHGVTLAFGASLIGVSIDYVVHLYCHHAVRPEDPHRTAVRLWPALLTGAGTTIVGFLALGLSRFPGLREVAVFAVTGVGAALLATRYVVPALLPSEVRAVGLREALIALLVATLARIRANRPLVGAIAVALALAAGYGATHVQWREDMADMASLDPELLAEDERVRSRVTSFEQTRFVVAMGPDDESALQANDRAALALEEAVAAGELRAYRSAADLLPSAATQVAVASVAVDDPSLPARLEAAFVAAGFRPGAFAEFAALLEAGVPAPVTWDRLAASPLASLVRSFRVHIGDQVAYVSFLEGVGAPDALSARMARAGVLFVDQGAIMRDANRSYQRGTARALVAGMLAVLLVLGVRYRDMRRTLAAFAPAVLASAVTVAVLAMVGVGVDLVGLTALLMVVSMGVDYGVFLVDADDQESHDLSAALLSTCVACLSTVFGFGTLALSSHPVLHAIGLTAAVGVSTAFFVAPVALAVAGPSRARRRVTP